jgi:hypothetical protein
MPKEGKGLKKLGEGNWEGKWVTPLGKRHAYKNPVHIIHVDPLYSLSFFLIHTLPMTKFLFFFKEKHGQ